MTELVLLGVVAGFLAQTATINVSGVPRLYTLYPASTTGTGTLLLRVSPGVQAYDFTFG